MATSSARPPHLYDREVAIAPERETLSRALEQSEERFHRLAQRIAAGVFRVSTEGLIIEVNPAMVRMLGYDSEADLLGTQLSRAVFVDPLEGERLLRQLALGPVE